MIRVARPLCQPVPVYSGKVAAIFDNLGRNPYLVAGDSPGDLPMLALAPNRLWMARLNKPGYQEAALKCSQKTGREGWLIQPTLASNECGFIAEVTKDVQSADPQVTKSLRLLSRLVSGRSRKGRT